MDESYSFMMAQFFKYCYIFIIFNHWASEKKRMKVKGDYTESHKYLSGCTVSKAFISQILNILMKEEIIIIKQDSFSILSCHKLSPVKVYVNCTFFFFFIQWKQEQDVSYAVFRLVTYIYT